MGLLNIDENGAKFGARNILKNYELYVIEDYT